MEEIICRAREAGVSDIHITAGERIRFRRLGRLEVTDYRVDPACWREWWQGLLGEYETEVLAQSGAVEVSPESGVRVSLFRTWGEVAGAIRLLARPEELPPDPEPALLKKVAGLTGGLVVIGGVTGSGKTTTLRRILQIINRTRPVHVITLEDPPEYRLMSDVACIHQRGIGGDVPDWETGLASALRADPDVLVIGELRTTETVSAALRAAQTGHLVLATVHAGSIETIIGRLVHMFPAHSQEDIRYRLAAAVQWLVVQELVPLVQSQVVLREWVQRNPALVTVIRDGKENQLPAYLQTMGAAAQNWEQSRQRVLRGFANQPDDAALLRGWRR